MPEAPQHARLIAVCLGPGGVPKREVEQASVGELGLAGDGHRFDRHGGANRAVCLFSIEDYRKLERDGVHADPPGAFGENLLIEGLEFERMMPGDRLEVGEELVLEVHDVRAPCGTLKAIDERFPDLMLGRSGFLCRVITAGSVRSGSAVLHHSGSSPSRTEHERHDG